MADSRYCGAKKRQGEGTCKRPAGWGTEHPGTGRCKLHGGNNRSKPGNKNAVTTGQYETIFAGALDESELGVMSAAAAKTNLGHIEEEIALTTVRELRMLQRIANLKAVPDGLTLVEEATKTIAPDEEDEKPKQPFSDRWASEMPVDDPEVARSVEPGGGGDLLEVKRKRVGTLGQIQDIEAALTAVQAHKAKLIKLKHELEAAGDGRNPHGSGAPGDPDDVARTILEGLGAPPEGI